MRVTSVEVLRHRRGKNKPASTGDLLCLSCRGQWETCSVFNVQKHCLEIHCRILKAWLLKKYSYIHVHNSPKVNATQVSISRFVGKQMWYGYPVEYCSALKRGACWHMPSQGWTGGYAKWKKSVAKGERTSFAWVPRRGKVLVTQNWEEAARAWGEGMWSWCAGFLLQGLQGILRWVVMRVESNVKCRILKNG